MIRAFIEWCRLWWLLTRMFGVSTVLFYCAQLAANRYGRRLTLAVAVAILFLIYISGLVVIAVCCRSSAGKLAIDVLISAMWLQNFRRAGYSWAVAIPHVLVLFGLMVWDGRGSVWLCLAWNLWCMWLVGKGGQNQMRKAKAALQSSMTTIQAGQWRRQQAEAT